MMAGVYRLALLLLTLGSAALTYRSVSTILSNPALAPMEEQATDEIIALTDRLVAKTATPERLAELLDKRLAESPRNWIALEAIASLYVERGMVVPAVYAEALEVDSGILAQTAGCLACTWDIADCSLSTALICKVPIMLTPVEDVRGIAKAGVDYVSGTEIDKVDVGLSVVGLSATVLIVVSGGTSAGIKAGTSLVRMARGMRLLSPRLTVILTSAVADGIRWSDLSAVRGLDDMSGLVRAEKLVPLTDTLVDLGRVNDALGLGPTLHLLPLVDDAADARKLTRASEALGTRTASRAELLGKSTLFRATLRVSETAIVLVAGLLGLLTCIGAVLVNFIHTFALRSLRARSRSEAKTSRG